MQLSYKNAQCVLPAQLGDSGIDDKSVDHGTSASTTGKQAISQRPVPGEIALQAHQAGQIQHALAHSYK